MSAIADVARLVGVSKSTASRALSGRGYVSEGTRSRVVQAASNLGYVVSSNASSLVTGRTRNVGVVIPFINRWYFAETLEGIESALIGAGYDLTLYRLSEDADQRRRVFDDFLVRKRVDAVIAVGIALTSHEVDMLLSLGTPIVGIGGNIEGISTLSIDDVSAARFVTEHLVSLGHTRIMHLGGDRDEEPDFRVQAQRLAGFRIALEAAGITDNDGFRAVPYTIPGGYAGALAVLADMFGLTTLEQHPSLQGSRAVDLIMERLAAEPVVLEDERITMPVTLNVRSTNNADTQVLAHAQFVAHARSSRRPRPVCWRAGQTHRYAVQRGWLGSEWRPAHFARQAWRRAALPVTGLNARRARLCRNVPLRHQ